MRPTKKLFTLILEGIVYGISGSLFVTAIFLLEDYFDRSQHISGFPVQIEQSIGLIWLLSGLSFSSIFCSLIFRRAEFFLRKSLFLLLLSTFIPFFMQMTFLINHSTMIENLQVYSLEDIYGTIGIRLFTRLFIILTPFVFLFQGFRFLFDNLKKRNILS